MPAGNGVNGYHGGFKDGEIIGVGKQIPLVEHVYPELTVGDDLGGKGFLNDLPWCNGGDDDAAVFEEVLHGVPGKLEGVFKALNHALLLKRR